MPQVKIHLFPVDGDDSWHIHRKGYLESSPDRGTIRIGDKHLPATRIEHPLGKHPGHYPTEIFCHIPLSDIRELFAGKDWKIQGRDDLPTEE